MRITAIKTAPRERDRLEVWLDGEHRATLALEVVHAAGLRVDGDLDPAELAVLEQRDEAWRARQAGLTLLSHRARTAAELKRRLIRKGFAAPIAEACVRTLIADGWLRDDAFAESFVRERVRSRPRATRRLVQELGARGVDAALAARTVQAVFDDQALSEDVLARRTAREWWRRNVGGRAIPAPRSDAGRRLRRRLWGHLARRGFDADVIRAVTAPLFQPTAPIDAGPKDA